MAINQEIQNQIDTLNFYLRNSQSPQLLTCNYVMYINENFNLKFEPLIPHFDERFNLYFYCQFKEKAFITGVFLKNEPIQVNYPTLKFKERFFMDRHYFMERWLELEDYRKPESYFVVFNPETLFSDPNYQ
jgi:hypothetical protein